MSKKIAEGTDALVLDVKTGSGAFMREPDKAKRLAETMVTIGQAAGVKTRALITAMDVPLGLKIGNSLEVEESIEVLAGGGPPDLVALVIRLAEEMLELVGLGDKDPRDALASGRAMDRWRKMVRAQGGDPDAPLPVARHSHVVSSEADGTVQRMDARAFGVAAWRLGAGRSRKEDAVSLGAGIELHVRPGAVVSKGQPLFTLFTDDDSRFETALGVVHEGTEISNDTYNDSTRLPLILERIG
jgi:thymidine phosphorylase